jgi:hypothetical protein
MNRAKPVLMTVSGLLAMLAAFASVSGAEFAANSGAPEIYAPLPANELDALVAPIALYPDALLAQVLGATCNQLVRSSRSIR